jgi:hypothetical protein
MRKKTLLIIGGAGLAVVLFIAGFVAGVTFIIPIAGNRMLKDELVRATNIYCKLDQLNRNDVQGAKDALNIEMDGCILALDMFLADAPKDRTREVASVWLKRIALQRDQFPATIQLTNTDTRYGEARRAVSNALDRAMRNDKAEQRPVPDL